MSEFSKDKKKIREALMELPLRAPSGISPEDAMRKPGNCVKSKEKHPEIGFPRYMGRVSSYHKEKDEVIVVGHPDGFSEPFVWTGTVEEYFAEWDCD